jgi:putative peptide zinc metalloprotease protein
MLEQKESEIKLPSLREDLKLYPSIQNNNGSPSWVVYDPNNNKYYRIGWKEFEIISRWHLTYINKIVTEVNEATSLTIVENDVQLVFKFLIENELINIPAIKADEILLNHKKRAYISLWKKIIHNYLFLRIPILHPDAFLNKTAHFVRPIIHKNTIKILIILLIIGLYMVAQQWTSFKTTFMYFFTAEGMAYYAITIMLTKILHEMGHAYLANYFGCKVHTIGVAFIVLWPVLYTDTSDAWKLSDRKKQIIINAGGILVEIFIASIAMILWCWLNDGILKSMCFLTATSSLLLTLSINLNPLMRYDGYFLFADLWGIDNLQPVSFELGKWKIREFIFKFGHMPPYNYSKKQETLLILYAFTTWIYRFFLYLGIALLVYHLFFKIVGIIMMLIEIITLLLNPIIKELKVYYMMREHIKLQKINKALIFTVICCLGSFFIPWKTSMYIPATVHYEKESNIYAPHNAMVEKVYATAGKTVVQGEILAELTSLELDYSIQEILKEIEKTKTKLRQDLQLLDKIKGDISNDDILDSLNAKLAGLQAEKTELTIRAPFAGIIVSSHDNLQKNMYVVRDQLLFEIIEPNHAIVEAYIEENYLSLVDVNKPTKFCADTAFICNNAGLPKIATTSIKNLDNLYLSSIFGGTIASERELDNSQYNPERNHTNIIPNTTIFRVTTTIEQTKRQVSTGMLLIHTKATSYFSYFWKNLRFAIIRENSF